MTTFRITQIDRPDVHWTVSSALVVGRGEEADVRLDAPGVSRRHAILSIQDGFLVVRDAGSVNGVFLDGRRISDEAQVSPGSRLEFGAAPVLTVGICGEEAETVRLTRPADSPSPASDAPLHHAAIDGPSPRSASVRGVALGLATAALVVFGAWGLAGDERPARRVWTVASPAPGNVVPAFVRTRLEGPPEGASRVVWRLDGREVGEASVPPFSVELRPEPGQHLLEADVLTPTGDLFPSAASCTFSRPLDAPSHAAGSSTVGASLAGDLAERFLLQLAGRSGFRPGDELSSMIAGDLAVLRPDFPHILAVRRASLAKACTDRGIPPLLGALAAAAAAVDRIPKDGRPEGAVASTEDPDIALAERLRDLTNLFDREDLPYALAVLEADLSEAGRFRAAMEAADPRGSLRRDFAVAATAVPIPPQRRRRLARILAIGILMENPERFGLPGPPVSAVL